MKTKKIAGKNLRAERSLPRGKAASFRFPWRKKLRSEYICKCNKASVKYLQKGFQPCFDLSRHVVSPVNAVSVQDQHRNTGTVEGILDQGHTADGLLAAPMTEVDGSVTIQGFSSFYNEVLFGFEGAVVKISDHLQG